VEKLLDERIKNNSIRGVIMSDHDSSLHVKDGKTVAALSWHCRFLEAGSMMIESK